MIKRIIVIGITGILLFSGNSCMKDDIIIDTDQISKFDRPLNLAGPVAKVRVNASDLIGRLNDSVKAHIQTDDDGLLNAKYSDSINVIWDDIVKLENVQEEEQYPVIIPPGMSGLSETISFEERIKLNANNDQRFDSMYVRSSTLSINVQIPSGLSADIMISFPEISKDGTILEIPFNSSEQSMHEERILDGYKVYFKQGTDSSYITMQISAQNITAQNSDGFSDNITVNLTLTETVPEIIFGSFGSSEVVNRDENLRFSIFNDLMVFDKVEFYDIQLDINFESHYGVAYEATIEDAMVSSSYKNDSIELSLSGNNTFYVEAATYDTAIVPTFNTKHFDNANSNIRDAIHILPDNMDYHVEINTNPGDPGSLNFVTGENKISGQLNVLVPLWFKCENYSRVDTIQEFNVDSIFKDEYVEYLDSVTLLFSVQNWFPFDLDIQAYVADDNFNIVDSLFAETQQFLVSGILNDNDEVSEAGVSEEINVVLTKDQIEEYKAGNVTKILIPTKTATSENGSKFVKILESYGLEFKLSIEIVSD